MPRTALPTVKLASELAKFNLKNELRVGMVALSVDNQTPEESLVHWAIIGTWGVWAIGGLYHFFPILAWTLALWGAARKCGLTTDDPEYLKPVPIGVWIWIGSMGLMALALVGGLVAFDYSLMDILKALFGWAKGWALMAVLPFAGATLRIRPQVLIRAMNILSAQTLILTPIFMLSTAIGLPQVLYVSPLYNIGGASSAFFEIGTYWIDPGTTDVRFRFYAPWGPAAALVAQVAFVMGLFDRDKRWRAVAVVSAAIVCYLAKSRLSLVAIPILIVAIPALSQIYRPLVVGIVGSVCFSATIMLDVIVATIEQAVTSFNNARADSSRVRATLQRIAFQRWSDDDGAMLFGHGAVERGSHLVEFMPIGSHHTWYGLLFVKGSLGFLALSAPFLWTFLELLIKAQRDRTARAALGVILVLFINSFGENLEILCYLIWPGLLLIGVAMRRRYVGLWTTTLGC